MMKSYEEAKRRRLRQIEDVAKASHNLWLLSLPLHRCVACTAQDLEEKIAIAREHANGPDLSGLGCLEFCKDAGWVLKAVGPREAAGVGGMSSISAKGHSASEFVRLMPHVSVQVGVVWEASLSLAECAACAEAILRKEIARWADKTRLHIPEGGGRGGYRRVCRRCESGAAGAV